MWCADPAGEAGTVSRGAGDVRSPPASCKITTGCRSQNHRMFGVGRDLCGSSSPTPWPKQGHPEQAAQDRHSGAHPTARAEHHACDDLLRAHAGLRHAGG